MKTKHYKTKELTGLQPTLDRRSELKKGGYTIPQLMRVTGMSRRKVRHWTECKILTCLRDTKARGSQHASFYSADTVMKALIVCEMTRRGLSLAQVRRVEKYLKKKKKQTLTESAKYLVTDGTRAFYAEDATTVIDILKQRNQMLLIPVWEHMIQVKRRLRREALG